MGASIGRRLARLYEPFMAIAAVAMAASVVVPYVGGTSSAWLGYASALAWWVYGVFLADHLWRFWHAPDKRRFLRQHWVETLSFVPLGLASGVLRWFRLVRAAVMLRRYSDFFRTVFLRHGFLYVAAVTFGLVLSGAWAIHRVEPGIGSFGDALWWSFVTTTTVGYGDIAPKTADGRLVAVGLMLFGIGFISLFTGTVASFFLERLRQPAADLSPTIVFLKERIEALPSMTLTEYGEFAALVDAVYQNRAKGVDAPHTDLDA